MANIMPVKAPLVVVVNGVVERRKKRETGDSGAMPWAFPGGAG
jgi:hypothetical protein